MNEPPTPAPSGVMERVAELEERARKIRERASPAHGICCYDLRDSLAMNDELIERVHAAEAALAEARAAERRLRAMLPLFEEARDALCAISEASRKLHGVRSDLADRMDDVGVPSRWAELDRALGGGREETKAQALESLGLTRGTAADGSEVWE